MVVVGTTALEFFRGLPRSFWSSTAADASGAAASGTSPPTGTLDPSAKADMPGVVINHNILALYIYYSFIAVLAADLLISIFGPSSLSG